MLRVFLSFLLCACALTSPDTPTDTTFTLPLETQSRVIAPGGTNVIDIDAIAPGGNNNTFVRGTSGSWISLRQVPFARQDTLIFYVSRALPPNADHWLRPVPTWFYVSTIGGVVLPPGTNYLELGMPRWDANVGCCIAQHGKSAFGSTTHGGPGRWGFGAGGSPALPAQDGMIRVRFYPR